MKNALRPLALLALLTAGTLTLLPACEQKGEHGTDLSKPAEEDLSAADLINNPNTANPQEVPVPNDLGVMTFKQKEYDFGDIHQGQVVTHVFQFENTGKKPIVIDNASSSCGCTVPTYPRKPVAPGETGEVTVQFDSHGKSGVVNKVVVIRANTQPNIAEVSIRANVLVP